MEVINLIAKALAKIITSPFQSDMDVMSVEGKRIFSNEDDRKKYIDAIEKLQKNPHDQQTITLSTNEKITLVS